MIKDFSYGIIPVRLFKNRGQVFLVKNLNGHYWGFPKGHAENDETSIEAAKRELLEETGLTIESLIDNQPIDEKYIFGHQGQLIEKKVFYYLAIVSKGAVIQRDEIVEGKWVDIEDVEKTLTYEASKMVFQQAKKILNSKFPFIS